MGRGRCSIIASAKHGTCPPDGVVADLSFPKNLAGMRTLAQHGYDILHLRDAGQGPIVNLVLGHKGKNGLRLSERRSFSLKRGDCN